MAAASARVRTDRRKNFVREEFSKVEISRVKISKISSPELGASPWGLVAILCLGIARFSCSGSSGFG